MTQNQIAFQNHLETVRHNLATEGLTGSELDIKRDSNRINEEHYKRSDEAGFITAAANTRNAESNALNALSNARNAETNQYNSLVNKQNAETNARNAATNARNAATNERNAETAFQEYRLDVVEANIAQQNADSKQLEAEAAWQNATNNFFEYGLYDSTQHTQAAAAQTRAQAAADLVNSQVLSNYANAFRNTVQGMQDFTGILRNVEDIGDTDELMSFPGSANYHLLGGN